MERPENEWAEETELDPWSQAVVRVAACIIYLSTIYLTLQCPDHCNELAGVSVPLPLLDRIKIQARSGSLLALARQGPVELCHISLPLPLGAEGNSPQIGATDCRSSLGDTELLHPPTLGLEQAPSLLARISTEAGTEDDTIL